MNYIIQTGTDGNGDAITTTLDVQWSWTYELVSHETQNFVKNLGILAGLLVLSKKTN